MISTKGNFREVRGQLLKIPPKTAHKLVCPQPGLGWKFLLRKARRVFVGTAGLFGQGPTLGFASNGHTDVWDEKNLLKTQVWF